jgi:hypothetical protein
MRIFFGLLLLMMFLGACCAAAPVESTKSIEDSNAVIADKGICGDKVCKGKEADPQDAAYCKQDCYPS